MRVSVNDFVVKAAATALQYVPEMNLNVSGEDFEVREHPDMMSPWKSRCIKEG